MRYEAARNWFLIAIAVGSPYYWISYMFEKGADATVMTVSILLALVAILLLVFLLRKQYVEIGDREIALQTPLTKHVWKVEEIEQVGIDDQIVSLLDREGKARYLMIPQKKERLEEMKKSLTTFCRHHKIPVTQQDLVRQSKKSPGAR